MQGKADPGRRCHFLLLNDGADQQIIDPQFLLGPEDVIRLKIPEPTQTISNQKIHDRLTVDNLHASGDDLRGQMLTYLGIVTAHPAAEILQGKNSYPLGPGVPDPGHQQHDAAEQRHAYMFQFFQHIALRRGESTQYRFLNRRISNKECRMSKVNYFIILRFLVRYSLFGH